MALQTADRLISARWVIPVEPPGAVLEHHAVAISGNEIVEVAPTDRLASMYPAAEHVRLDGHVLLPGFVNLHTHAAMALMRGVADDRALMDWLKNYVWPTETRLVSPEFVYDGTLLACAEMLRGGITCFGDMYFYPDAVGQAALNAGMRAALGMIVIEMPSKYASDARDYLNRGLAVRDSMRGEPLLSFCFAPHAPYTVSDATFELVATYAAELDVPIHMHVHETQDEITESISAFGTRPLARLERLGLLTPGLIAVHAVHLEPHEIDLLAQHGCSVAHCPSSNLKLASGLAPVARMIGRGINVGLGTDGAASNNRLDVMKEMHLAALLAKGVNADPMALPAHTVIQMATLAGARALGLERSIGSLTAGKRADVIAIDLAQLELEPCYDPASHLVYCAGREHVTHVWVNGKLRVERGALLDIDSNELRRKAAQWKNRILQ